MTKEEFIFKHKTGAYPESELSKDLDSLLQSPATPEEVSDEEINHVSIEENSMEVMDWNDLHYQSVACDAFERGAKYMRSKLKGSKQGWVSCKDGLPEEGQDIICASSRGVYCYTHSYIGGLWYANGSPECTEGITHWMPLPEPPKTQTT